jgi:hypothetical protein
MRNQRFISKSLATQINKLPLMPQRQHQSIRILSKLPHSLNPRKKPNLNHSLLRKLHLLHVQLLIEVNPRGQRKLLDLMLSNHQLKADRNPQTKLPLLQQ